MHFLGGGKGGDRKFDFIFRRCDMLRTVLHARQAGHGARAMLAAGKTILAQLGISGRNGRPTNAKLRRQMALTGQLDSDRQATVED